jgi:catechol 2,3-dioxygenase-like lactoylglutathione lyase family enzyme
MDLTIARCFVTVTDPDKALAFYRDVLGLELVMDVPNGDFRWITVGSKSQPGVQIVLSNYIQGSPDDLAYVAGLVAKGALNAVHFRTDDLDGLFVKLAEAYQAVGIRAEKPSELDDAIKEMIAVPKPVIFDCRVDKHANCFPMIPSGEAHNHMLMGDDLTEQDLDNAITEEGKVMV